MDSYTIEEKSYAIAMNSFRGWEPTADQLKAGVAIFRDGNKFIFVRCGRKFGKTEIAIYILYRLALTIPNAGLYYLAPLAKQAKEIVWASNRIQTFVDPSVIESVNQQEMRIRLYNGSFIKVDGSDNFNSYRGIEPHGLVLDEFREHDPRLLEAMKPNLAVHNAPLIIIGTPPPTRFKEDGEPNHYYEQELRAKARQEQGRGLFLHSPTHSNPHISKEWLAEEEADLKAEGREWEWRREYLAEYANGGEGIIFPMFDRQEVAKSHEKALQPTHKDRDDLIWVAAADPGSTSCFAVLFFAINPYTKEVFVLDEVYETDRMKTSTDSIMPQVIAKQQELYPRLDRWMFVYDEAAAWFFNESIQRFGSIPWIPSNKAWNKKENNISLVKDILNYKRLTVSEKCSKFCWEMEAYKTDDKEKVVKKWDHLIDCFFYGLSIGGYTLTEEDKKLPVQSGRRYHTPYSDARADSIVDDPFGTDFDQFDVDFY